MNLSKGLEASPGAGISFIEALNKSKAYFSHQKFFSIFVPKNWVWDWILINPGVFKPWTRYYY